MYNVLKFNFKTSWAQRRVCVPWYDDQKMGRFMPGEVEKVISQLRLVRLFKSHNTNTRLESNSELLLTRQTCCPGVDTIQCGVSGVPPLAAWWRGWGPPAQTGWLETRSVLRSLASPSDVSAGRSHQGSFTACFHVSFNEETAGSAACYKTQAN